MNAIITTALGALTIGILTFFVLTLVGFIGGFLWFYVRLVYSLYRNRRKRRAMTTEYTFKLYRRIRNDKTGGVFTSAFNLQVTCDDPFVERIRLARLYPGWAIATDFVSATDETFDTMFG